VAYYYIAQHLKVTRVQLKVLKTQHDIKFIPSFRRRSRFLKANIT